MKPKTHKFRNLWYGVYCYTTGIYSITRDFLKRELHNLPKRPLIIDVGGRKSPYTYGLPLQVVVADIPRETQIQDFLHLGFTDEIIRELKERKNVKDVVFDDMTQTHFAENTFDGAISIEVIEHVPEDELFVKNISKVLKPGGFLILSTPNGDHKPCVGNPDHIRHYKKAELEQLLQRHFDHVEVYHAVPDTWVHDHSHAGIFSVNFIKGIFSTFCGVISAIHTRFTYKNTNPKKIHLFARCTKAATSKPMHVCFITDEYPQPNKAHGGIGTFVHTIAHQLVLQGHTVTVVGGDTQNKVYNDGAVKIYQVKNSHWIYGRFYDYYSRVDKLLKKLDAENHFDIIEGSELSFAWINKIPNVKYVMRLHGGHHFFNKLPGTKFSQWTGFQERRSFHRADHFIGVSQYVIDVTNKYISMPASRVSKLYCPLNCNKFYEADPQKIVPFKIVFAGTICEKKGIRQLVLAMPAIKKQFPNVQLDIYGRDWNFSDGSSYLEYLRTFIDEELVNAIHFLGPMLHDDMPHIYETAHVCIFPSHMETQGIVVLEAMSMGKAVIFSTKGPGPETIDHLVNGILVNPHSPQDIAQKINHLFAHPGLEITLGQAARKKILERNDLAVITQQNIQLFQSLRA